MDTVSFDEEQVSELYGWYSHFVAPVGEGQVWVNYHTHGLPEHFGHPDFQLVLPLHVHTLHALATELVERVKKGERFPSGKRVSGVIENHDVLLIATMETRGIRRRVLRVILPDKDGSLDRASLTGVFAAQFGELPD